MKEGIHSATDRHESPLTAGDRIIRTLAVSEGNAVIEDFPAARISSPDLGAELECNLAATV
ncbi:hypothetical protein [Pseudomonas sp. F3-2]|uniref:hypothetical protein n=1 Tax=Pseudomonas sp. F3-2 TaxID=3141539 RepID=UPI00315D1B04